MTDFGPTRGDLIFRLTVSLTGLALVALAIILRGVPTDAAHAQMTGLALAFLVASSWLSARGLKRFED